MLLTMFLFQKWLGSPLFWRCLSVVTLDALTSASVHSLCLNWLCLTVFSSWWSSLLLVHLFLSNFFLPVNFAFNMLWYSTPWTATPFSNDPLWLTLFVGGCQWSSSGPLASHQCPHYCAFNEQAIPRISTLWMVIYWNSNILRSRFLTFISCKL